MAAETVESGTIALARQAADPRTLADVLALERAQEARPPDAAAIYGPVVVLTRMLHGRSEEVIAVGEQMLAEYPGVQVWDALASPIA
jgi:hypothetical protein